MNALVLQFKKVTPLCPIVFALGCFVLRAQAIEPAAPATALPGGNTADGDSALAGLTTGSFNSAFGGIALFSNGPGNFNTGVGYAALLLNTANENTATGAGALFSNTTGADNTANGTFALFNNTTGINNTAIGDRALVVNTTGNANTANGNQTLRNNTTGFSNTAVGDSALLSNTTGAQNTANGGAALVLNTTGSSNTASGYQALISNTTGNLNTATGAGALSSDTIGSENTANGFNALLNNTTGSDNTANGRNALLHNTTGSGNTALGVAAGQGVTTANFVTCIGADGDNVDSTTWIGNVFGVTTVSGTTAPVIVSDGGQLGTLPSSERFKKDISTMERASEAILSLRPVTFHYKTDTKGTPQFGLIAEEVAKVNPVLVLPDKEGKPYTVRYDAVNAMLLNEFLKEHKAFTEERHKVAKLEATVAQQQRGMEALTATVKEQAAKIQRVGAQLESGKTAPQVAENNQ